MRWRKLHHLKMLRTAAHARSEWNLPTTPPSHCAGFSFGAGNQPTVGLVPCDRKLAGQLCGIQPGIHAGIHGIGHSWPRVNNPVNGEVNSETPHLPGRCNSRCNSETALLELGVSKVFPGCFHANQGFPIGTPSPGTQAGTHGIPVLLAQVETALTSTDGGSEITHFPARVETAFSETGH